MRLRRARGAGESQPLEARAAYEMLAEVYPPVAHTELMRLEEAALDELLPDARGAQALDVGCGSGRHLRRLIAGGARRVVGCDLAAAMLARARHAAPGARLARADARALPFRARVFDLVVCGLALGHVAELRAALAEIARVLAPGGVAVWSDLHPAGTLAGWKRDFRDAQGRLVVVRQHLHLFADHLRACRAAGLVLEDAREPLLQGDHPQRGWPALLVLRARRP